MGSQSVSALPGRLEIRMSFNRRNFILEAQAAILGLGCLNESAFAQTMPSDGKISADVVDFWVHRMGLSADAVIGGSKTRGRQPAGELAREPLLLYYDPDDNALITADQVPLKKLAEASDTDLQFQLRRMRLNADDDKQFRNYSSGGIYVDFQQSATQTPSMLESLASALFSSISPRDPKGAGKGGPGSGSGGSNGKAGPGKGKGKSFLADPPAANADSGNSIPLQAASQSQTISLPSGAGKHSLACFVKDKRKTLFGNFVSIFGTLLNSPAATYLPMLSLPVIGTPALDAIKSLVANLQAHGGDQQFIMMSPPVDIVTTQASAKSNSEAIRFRPGQYIMIPKEHSAAMRDQLGKLKVLDGFLVPNNASELDVYDTYASTAPAVSYITVTVSVQPSKSDGGKGKAK